MSKDDYIDGLRKDVADLVALLEPLKSGKLIIGDGRPGGDSQKTAEAYLAHMTRIINDLQAIVDRHDA